MQIQSNCMRYLLNYPQKFAKRAQITLEVLQKVICYPLEFINKMTMIDFFCEPLLILHYSTYYLTKFSNMYNIIAALLLHVQN
jgi:hypothetical protein